MKIEFFLPRATNITPWFIPSHAYHAEPVPEKPQNNPRISHRACRELSIDLLGFYFQTTMWEKRS